MFERSRFGVQASVAVFLLAAIALGSPDATGQTPIHLADTEQSLQQQEYDALTVTRETTFAATYKHDVPFLLALRPGDNTYAELLVGEDLQDVFMSVGPQALIQTSSAELYLTDGTESGTRSIGTIAYDLAPRAPISIPGRTLFWGRGSNEAMLFGLSDAGEIEPLFPDAPESPIRLIARDDGAYFMRANCELQFSDGTAAGTGPLFAMPFAEPPTGSEGCEVHEGPGGRLLVVRLDEPGAWLTDGTRAGTVTADHLASATEALASGDDVYFLRDGDLWRSDGTEVGTTRITDQMGAIRLWSLDDGFVILSQSGGIFAFDGLTEATVSLSSEVQNATQAFRGGSQLYLVADDELWRTDGTPQGTSRLSRSLKRTSTSPLVAASDQSVVFVGSHLGEIGLHQIESTANSGETIWPIEDFQFTADSEAGHFSVVGPSAFFRYRRSGPTAWAVTDGTMRGTRVVDTIGASDRFIGAIEDRYHLAVIDDEMVRIVDDVVDGATPLPDTREPFETNEGFTEKLFVQRDEGYLVNVFPRAADGSRTAVMLVSRATVAGVEHLTEIRFADDYFGRPAWNGWIDDEGRLEIYSENCRHWLIASDGTIVASEVVDTPCANGEQVDLRSGRIVPRWDGVWKTTDDGLEPLVTPGDEQSTRRTLVHAGLAYVEVTKNRGTELWVTDGSEAGTRRLSSDLPFWEGSVPYSAEEADLIPAGDALLFMARDEDGVANIYLHRDGEEVRPILPGEGFGSAAQRSPVKGFTFLNDRIIYNGFHPDFGDEPFAIELETVPLPGDADSPDEPEVSETPDDSSGCGCGTTPPAEGATALLLLAVVLVLGRWPRNPTDQSR